MLNWESLGSDEMEAKNDKYDFHIYNEPDMGIILDVFNVNDSNDDTAHIDSVHCESVEDAKNTAETYQHDPDN